MKAQKHACFHAPFSAHFFMVSFSTALDKDPSLPPYLYSMWSGPDVVVLIGEVCVRR